MVEEITEAGLRRRAPLVSGIPKGLNQTLRGFLVPQRPRPQKHRMPPAPFELVEARRGPQRPCEFCAGTGSFTQHPPGDQSFDEDCEVCAGVGTVGRRSRPRNRRHGRPRGR